MNENIKLRSPLKRFAYHMEKVLRDNDDKGGWEDLSADELIERIEEELNEIRDLVEEIKDRGCEGRAASDVKDLRHECADVANYAMMLHDRAHNVIYALTGKVKP